MAFLKYFEIESEQRELSPQGVAFRMTAYHVKEIFLYFLPSNFYLDGSSKFQITLCSGKSDIKTSTVLGVTEYKIENFDFRRYVSLPPRAQEECILNLILTSFLDYCATDQSPFVHVESACKKVLESDFTLRYEVEKLRKSVRTAKLKVRVFRFLSRYIGEAWQTEVERGGVTKNIEIRKSGFTDLTSYFRKSQIENGVYSIVDSSNKKVFSVDLEEVLRG